jgi:hypothetical protein
MPCRRGHDDSSRNPKPTLPMSVKCGSSDGAACQIGWWRARSGLGDVDTVCGTWRGASVHAGGGTHVQVQCPLAGRPLPPQRECVAAVVLACWAVMLVTVRRWASASSAWSLIWASPKCVGCGTGCTGRSGDVAFGPRSVRRRSIVRVLPTISRRAGQLDHMPRSFPPPGWCSSAPLSWCQSCSVGAVGCVRRWPGPVRVRRSCRGRCGRGASR